MIHRSYFQVNIQRAYCTGYLNLCFSQQNSLFCKLQVWKKSHVKNTKNIRELSKEQQYTAMHINTDNAERNCNLELIFFSF